MFARRQQTPQEAIELWSHNIYCIQLIGSLYQPLTMTCAYCHAAARRRGHKSLRVVVSDRLRDDRRSGRLWCRHRRKARLRAALDLRNRAQRARRRLIQPQSDVFIGFRPSSNEARNLSRARGCAFIRDRRKCFELHCRLKRKLSKLKGLREALGFTFTVCKWSNRASFSQCLCGC